MTLLKVSSLNGSLQPPYLKPPDVSSFFPPGACRTPSRLIIDITVIFLMVFFRFVYKTKVGDKYRTLVVRMRQCGWWSATKEYRNRNELLVQSQHCILVVFSLS